MTRETLASRPNISTLTLAFSSVLSSKYAVWLGLAAVLLVALLVRIVDLNDIPANVTADETDDLQNAYRVIYGTAGGLFGLDWNQAPNFNMYLKAGVVVLFGESIAGARMYGVVLSMSSLALFYPLARRRLEPLPALLATLLLATNLWFLVFSRTPWVAMSSVFAAILAALLLDVALKRKQSIWPFLLLGVSLAFGAYGYFAGRALILVIAASYAIALLLKEGAFRSLTFRFAISGFVAFLIFAPQLKTILDNWDYANTRPRSVSIFNVDDCYLGDCGTAAIMFHQTLRAGRGFLLLDKTVVNRGLWERQHPQNWAFLDQATGIIYWVGLAASLFALRRYIYWWVFMLIPLFVTQVFSVGTPDASRGLIAAPFMYLFVGLGIQTLIALLSRRIPVSLVGASAIAIAIGLSVFNLHSYFNWTNGEKALAAREPAVQQNEFAAFLDLVKIRARQGRILSADELKILRSDTEGTKPLADSRAADAQRIVDLRRIAVALEDFKSTHAGYPSTDGRLQTACAYLDLDVLCVLAGGIDSQDFSDRRSNPGRYGYWYTSDGKRYALFATLENPIPDAELCRTSLAAPENVPNLFCVISN